MKKLNPFQQGLWERYQQAKLEIAEGKEAVELGRKRVAEASKDAEMYWRALYREGVNVEKLEAALEAEAAKEASQQAEEAPHPSNGFNKTHAVIAVMQKYAENGGFGPTELWEISVNEYQTHEISRSYVNTLMGKLKRRGIVEQNEVGKYRLTASGRNFPVEMGI